MLTNHYNSRRHGRPSHPRPAANGLLAALLATLTAALAGCGGGGGAAEAAGLPPTVAVTLAAAEAAEARVAPVAAPQVPPAIPPAIPPVVVATPAASPPSAPARANTGGGLADTPPSNSATVGTARALSAAASLSLAGVPDLAPPAAPMAAAASGGRTFFVDSATGNDLNDGRAATAGAAGAGPWQSLARVLQSGLGAGDTLTLACGSTWRETLRLPASGTAARPILVTAPPAGCTTAPAIDGSVTLPPAAWTLYRGNIYKATLDAAPLQVFPASGVLNEAHHPNRGYLAADPASPYLALAADGNVVTTNKNQGSTTLTTGADLVLPAGAHLTAGARVRVRVYSWLMDEATITAVNGNRLTLSKPTTYPVTAGWGYLLLGQLWMLDSPGEWQHDAGARLLYAWMPDSAAPAAPVRATVLGVGIELNERAHVVIDGLTVRRVGSGIQLRGSQGVRVRNTRVEDVVEIGADAAFSSAATFESNTFERIGHDAISGQDDNTGPATGMVVRGNLIRDAGVLMQGEQVLSLPRRSHGAIRAGVASVVAGNAVINAGYVGIRLMGGSVVEDNFVFGACTVLDDCAGIYIWSARDSIIRRNTVVHARGALAGKPAAERSTQAQGIYLDESTTGVLVEDNTVIDTDHGIQIHISAGNTVRGNRLYGNRVSQIRMQETSAKSNPNGDVFGNLVEANQIAAVDPGSVGLLLDTRYASTAAFGSFDSNRYFDRGTATVAYENTASGRHAYTLAQWRGSRNVGSQRPVDANGAGVSATGYAAYSVSGANLISNSTLARDTAGWATWNQSAPAGQLMREACAAGTCLRYVAGGSPGIVLSPNFSLQQGQWYRLAVDLATEQDDQPVTLLVRRGGGGGNGYESLSDRNLALTAHRAWGRYSVVFQATKTINTHDPATGDIGARVDIEGIEPGKSVSLANLELLPVAPGAVAQTSGALVNVASTARTAACPLAGSRPEACGKLIRLADDRPVVWPVTLAPHSAVIFYANEPALLDSDHDGVPDAQDRCPGTAAGAAVNASGCSYLQR